jgi:hypothetical protein
LTLSKQHPRRVDYSVHSDLEQSLVGLRSPRVRRRARRIPQHNTPRSIRPVACRVGRPENRHDWNLQCSRQVKWPGVAADK